MNKFFRGLFRRARKKFHKSRPEDLSQDVPDSVKFQCSICQDVLTDPVSTPCGHNFCKKCISQHWSTQIRCDCPLCGKVFKRRPLAMVNVLLSELIAEFRPAIKPGEVPCDICTGTKVKAVKSCRVCMVSYCQTHLEPHLTLSALKKHLLIEPVEDLEARMCPKHQQPLEMFCVSEQTSVCMMCAVLEHSTHKVVLLSEYEEQKMELTKTEAEIQKRRVKMEEIRKCLEKSNAAADREKADGVEVFTAPMESVETALTQLKERIEEEEEAREKQAEGFLKDLEEETCELTKRCSEVQQLLHSEENLNFLESFPSLKVAPPTKDWTEVSVRPSSYEETVARAVAELEETLGKEMKKLYEAELAKKQQFAVDVTFDPDTAHPYLILSKDGKRVRLGDVRKNLPDTPKRFSVCVSVLGRQSFSSGKFYFEVQVKGKIEWTLGVSKESINRKGKLTARPDKGFWAIHSRYRNQYIALNYHRVPLSLRFVVEKVGVFVDYEEGLVSFYDVDNAALIYSFTGCCFTDKVLPFFNTGLYYDGINAAPLIICPVNQTV